MSEKISISSFLSVIGGPVGIERGRFSFVFSLTIGII